MSHSSVANPVARRTAPLNNNPRRRKLSDLGLNPADSNHSEMALASDSLFDKFGLFAEQVQTCHHSGVQDEAVGAIADTGLADFENLDFADLLEIKDDPIEDQIQLDNEYITDNDPAMSAMFNMDNMESLMDDASLDSIKSDCMWSSVNLFPTLLEQGLNNSSSNANSRKRRHRDVSLTLSECAEGLLSINQLDVVNMLDQISGDDTPLGASPTFLSSSFGASSMMTSSAHEQNVENDSLAEETETDEDEDDEIDVVGNSDLGGSSARTRHCNLAINRTNNKKHHLKQQNNEQSRSLLKKQQKPPQTIKTSILDDHCYFLARPQQDIKPLKGMLTPNESSEDEDLFESQTASNFNTATTTITSNVNMVDKRKIAEAVQSLINNKPHGQNQAGLGMNQNQAGASANPNSTNNIKFKFRMKFKSTQAASNMKKAVNNALAEVNSDASDEGSVFGSASSSNNLHHRVSSCTSNESSSNNSVLSRQRRKSASKNSYCPDPTRSTRSNGSSPTKSQKKNNNTSHNSSRTTPTSSSTIANSNPASPDSEKCREIRDLHNSMERQRRVEQRNHLAYLKKQVPEVSDMEKASKLTILRKAMDYCHLLSNMDSRIRKDRDKEQARQERLKKTLLDLTQKHDARRVTTSGRLTGWTSSQRW